MTPKLTMGAKTPTASSPLAVRLVVVTMDTHLAGAIERAQRTLKNEIPGLTLTLHAASEYAGNDAAIALYAKHGYVCQDHYQSRCR